MADFNFTFNGTVNVPVLIPNNGNIPAGIGSPPFPTNEGTKIIQTVNPDNQLINWVSTVPAELIGQTVTTLVSQGGILSFDNASIRYEIDRSILTEITQGSQAPEASSQPLMNTVLFFNRRADENFNLPNLQWAKASGPNTLDQFNYCFPDGVCPGMTTTLDLINNEPGGTTPIFSSLTGVQLIPWNQGGNNASNQAAFNIELLIKMNVTLKVSCEGNALGSIFCLNFCSEQTNLINGTCFSEYQSFCLNTNGDDGFPNIFTDDGCQEYFIDYIQAVGPKAEIDHPLETACKRKFPGVDSFEASTSATDRALCGCHLDPEIYDNLWKDLTKDYPGYANLGINERCAFSACASSAYPSADIVGGKCNLPQCVNITSIENNGTIGGIKVTQTTGRCANITGGGNGGGGDNGGGVVQNTRSWIDHHWIWIVLGVGILIVLIIIILIIVAGESHKKPQKSKIDQYKTQ